MYSGERISISYFIYATAIIFAEIGTQKSTALLNSNECGKAAFGSKPPWMAAFFYNRANGTKIYGCAGSLIADQWILTAAHCISLKLSHIRLGDLYINATHPSTAAIEVKVQNQIPHPDYQTYPNQLKSDIGLIYLSEPVQFTDKILPVCLTRFNDIYNARHVYTSGWGFTVPYEPTSPPNTTSYSPVMKHVSVSLVPHYICGANYAKCPGNPQNDIMSVDGPKAPEISEGVLCAAGPNGEGSCTGDSGGALVFRDNEKYLWFQGGIASFNCGCGNPKWPGGYTRVTSYIDWIEQMTMSVP